MSELMASVETRIKHNNHSELVLTVSIPFPSRTNDAEGAMRVAEEAADSVRAAVRGYAAGRQIQKRESER